MPRSAYALRFSAEQNSPHEVSSSCRGGFEPLRYIGKQKVVLGLVTSKDAKLENKEDVIARIREASKYVPLEQLATDNPT